MKEFSSGINNLIPDTPEMPHVYVIINGTLAPNQQRAGDCLLPLALRTLSQLGDACNVANLYAIQALAGENHFDWDLVFIPSPDDVQSMKNVQVPDPLDFDTSKMKCLYQAGQAFGMSAQRWSMKMPDLDKRPNGIPP